jgi:hypothetical protein
MVFEKYSKRYLLTPHVRHHGMSAGQDRRRLRKPIRRQPSRSLRSPGLGPPGADRQQCNSLQLIGRVCVVVLPSLQLSSVHFEDVNLSDNSRTYSPRRRRCEWRTISIACISRGASTRSPSTQAAYQQYALANQVAACKAEPEIEPDTRSAEHGESDRIALRKRIVCGS